MRNIVMLAFFASDTSFSYLASVMRAKITSCGPRFAPRQNTSRPFTRMQNRLPSFNRVRSMSIVRNPMLNRFVSWIVPAASATVAVT